jgi:hypothetical protein
MPIPHDRSATGQVGSYCGPLVGGQLSGMMFSAAYMMETQ